MDDFQVATASLTTEPGIACVPPWRPTTIASPATFMRSRRLNVRHRLGELQFFLAREAVGLYVERLDLPKRGPRTIQALHFSGTTDFERWCDADTVRFDHPQLYVTLKREGERLWQLDGTGRPA